MSITVRRPALELPEVIDEVFVDGELEESYANAAFSLLLPHVEPYLIAVMKKAKPRVTSQTLREELERFCGQEGQHYRMHRELNERLRHLRSPELDALERRLADDYRRFSTERPLRFNLAYAEGFEALTTAAALFTEELDLFSRWQPQVRALFEWHLLEELEHRTVAFDVYREVVGSYPYRCAVGLFAQRHLLRFVERGMRAILAARPEVVARHGGRSAHRRRMRAQLGRFGRHLLPRVARTYLPTYDPRDLVMPADLAARLAAFG